MQEDQYYMSESIWKYANGRIVILVCDSNGNKKPVDHILPKGEVMLEARDGDYVVEVVHFNPEKKALDMISVYQFDLANVKDDIVAGSNILDDFVEGYNWRNLVCFKRMIIDDLPDKVLRLIRYAQELARIEDIDYVSLGYASLNNIQCCS